MCSKQTSSAWLTCLTVQLPKRHEANRVSRCKWESPVQIVKHPPGCLWYSNASLSVCVFVCVGRGNSNKSAGFVASTVAALFNVGWALCLRQAATGTAAHLSCQHSLCSPGIYLAVLFGCVHVCVHWIERALRFFPPFILGRREANDT